MKGFLYFMKEFANVLMVLESNIKANSLERSLITLIFDSCLTCLLIELRLKVQVNNIYAMLGLLQETGRD